ENKPTRKPGIAMLTKYTGGDYDLTSSFVIGDRLTDIQLAKNLGCKAILLSEKEVGEAIAKEVGLLDVCALITPSWDKVCEYLVAGERIAEVHRKTSETDIYVKLNLDGNGRCDISTGLSFFDHMLEQLGRHSGMDVTIYAKGDINVDEHHTVEDTGITIGEALRKALGDKRGIARYGFTLPMDDSLCSVALDFGGRAWLVWSADFNRERIGDLPTEMFMHFFKSLSDAAAMNLNIKADGANEHHKIEGIFKAFAKAIKMAITRDALSNYIPTTKGII
ncbi:MAG: imidazoleglycerol-phosphate dehydratase HisB, partial [Bacteroidales bacterium]